MKQSKATYILIDPNTDNGFNDDVIDRIEMTEEEAQKLNDERRENNSDLRWIKDAE